jgi:predicted small metal-binding protein
VEKDKELYCRDMGLDCDFLACGKTEQEVFQKTARHMQTEHHMEEFSQELYDKARVSVREGYCDYGDAEAEEATSEACSECYEECFECADECCY